MHKSYLGFKTLELVKLASPVTRRSLLLHWLIVICSELKVEQLVCAEHFIWQCGFVWFSRTNVTVAHWLSISLLETFV